MFYLSDLLLHVIGFIAEY
ncbi:hypothetical protein ACSLVK_14665 [Photorhabdus tasmaniensis]